MNGRGRRVFSSFSFSSCSARLYSSSVVSDLPHIKAAIVNKIREPHRIALFENIMWEYQSNPVVRPLLSQVDTLLREQRFQIMISPSLAMDKQHLDMRKSICRYDAYSNVLLLPSSLDAYQHLFPQINDKSCEVFYKNPEIRYLCMFLHEANHAHDFLVGGFKITKADAIAIITGAPNKSGLPNDQSLKKFERVLGISYSHEVMNQLKIALRNDLIWLSAIASKDTHPDKTKAQNAIAKVKSSLMSYQLMDLLLEFKSRYIEFSAGGSLGAEFMQSMFPAVTNWYLSQHMPACQQALDQTIKLRK